MLQIPFVVIYFQKYFKKYLGDLYKNVISVSCTLSNLLRFINKIYISSFNKKSVIAFSLSILQFFYKNIFKVLIGIAQTYHI